jgi:hypothetical protein
MVCSDLAEETDPFRELIRSTNKVRVKPAATLLRFVMRTSSQVGQNYSAVRVLRKMKLEFPL